MSIGRRVHVISTKYDGSAHWEFNSRLVLVRDTLVVTQDFAGQIYHSWKGPHTEPFDVRNHFWTDRWYNVMRCDRPHGGGLEYWYCNVTSPAQYDGETVRYIDLDLDVLVFPDGKTKVVDEDEFLDNSARMGYPPDMIEQSRRAVDEIVALARSGQFPFEHRSA